MKQAIIGRKDALALGLKRYFTGKPCKNGHMAERYVRNSACLGCQQVHYRSWCMANREKKLDYCRKWYEVNQEQARGNAHKWREANRERKRAHDRAWREANPNYQQDRRASDPQFAIAGRLRARLRYALNVTKAGKHISSINDCGCTLEELMRHIEQQFVWGMSWYNRDLWEIDHIRPMASFDLTQPAQQREACHFSNLQPLWRSENRAKGARMVEP
jgi:hypothetical protein